MPSRKVGIAYIPVLHKGYFDFIDRLKDQEVEALYLISDEILESHEELDYINRKDRLRALPHIEMLKLLQEYIDIPVYSLTLENVMELKQERVHIHAPREDVNESIHDIYFGGHLVTYHGVFLRWNRLNTGEENEPDTKEVSADAFQMDMFARAVAEAEKSTDWWRQVGAALVKEGSVISIGHNEHMPEEEAPNILGDTRALYKKGMNINYVTAAHAEVSVLGDAARKGVATQGAELFVTDFPCPYCARLIAKAGIKKLYYLRGYAVLEGDVFLKEAGIETYKIKDPE